MIHAFLATIGVLAAIALFPYIAVFTVLILTSRIFWLTIGGIIALPVLLYLGPWAVIALGCVCLLLLVMNWAKRINQRQRDSALDRLRETQHVCENKMMLLSQRNGQEERERRLNNWLNSELKADVEGALNGDKLGMLNLEMLEKRN